MYKYILPYDSHTDKSSLQAHNDAHSDAHNRSLRNAPRYPLARAIRTGTNRVRAALGRSLCKRSRQSMNWWH